MTNLIQKHTADANLSIVVAKCDVDLRMAKIMQIPNPSDEEKGELFRLAVVSDELDKALTELSYVMKFATSPKFKSNVTFIH